MSIGMSQHLIKPLFNFLGKVSALQLHQPNDGHGNCSVYLSILAVKHTKNVGVCFFEFYESSTALLIDFTPVSVMDGFNLMVVVLLLKAHT